jgi:hypothetical protein
MFIFVTSVVLIDFPEYHQDATLRLKKEQAPKFGACEMRN